MICDVATDGYFMTTWIFQANPDTYNIDEAIASGTQTIKFTVTRYHAEMTAGDQVFLWRSLGKAKAQAAGIIAEAVISKVPTVQPDDPASAQFWTEPANAATPQMRADLQIRKIANKKETLYRDWMLADPVLCELLILKLANGTNYRVPTEQAERLSLLWSMTGLDWSRDECVAGLWAYHRTLGGPVSKLPGSPVADVALQIGRAVAGVYNRVMNYRHLDPDDPREGMSGAGVQATAVWLEFYLPEEHRLDADALTAEYHRLWVDPSRRSAVSDANALASKQIADADELAKEKTLAELEALLAARKHETKLGRKPKKSKAITQVYDRDPLIVAIRKKRADHKCELPDCAHPLFTTDEGIRYCEVHHIVPLSEGGLDRLDNMICLCPGHHIEAHRGKNRDKLKQIFQSIRTADT